MSTLPVPQRERRIDAGLWLAAGIASALTAILSFTRDTPGAQAFPEADKVQHVLAYFLVTVCVLLAGVWRPGRGRGPLWAVRVWLPVAILAVGAGIEILQATVASRDGDVRDWLAELVGVGLAVVVVWGFGGAPRAERC